MKGMYRIAVVSPELRLGDARANASELIRLAVCAAKNGAAIVAFPELCLTGYTCGDLFFRDELLLSASEALETFATGTSQLPILSIVGLPFAEGPAIYNAAAVVYGGKVMGIVRKRALLNSGEYYERRQFTPAPQDEPLSVFDAGSFRFCIEICEDLWTSIPPSSLMAQSGVDVVLNLSASTDFLGKAQKRRDLVRQQSLRLGCIYAMACAGTGESCSDAVFGGGSLIAVNGVIVAEETLFSDKERIIASTVNLAALRYRRRNKSVFDGAWPFQELRVRTISVPAILPEVSPNTVSRMPFLDEYGETFWERKLVDIQAAALARRMESACVGKLVVGLSGGADSALALMGAAAALDRRGAARTNLIAVVMPGFGSSEDSQQRAIALGQAMRVTVRVVNIEASCRRHLDDIGHAEEIHDVTYENVQARERMQILMDIANMEGALVVGTGDLSEIALGWSTYNGDHMSMYQINASVPKTMVLEALRRIAKASDEPLKTVLTGIAAAPITPELLPDTAANDTEARLGPYELHDFFLFHYLANGASPDMLQDLAEIAFEGAYSSEVVGDTLKTFLWRFRSAQYKRNCVPDGPKITLSLSPRADWRMPSDLWG